MRVQPPDYNIFKISTAMPQIQAPTTKSAGSSTTYKIEIRQPISTPTRQIGVSKTHELDHPPHDNEMDSSSDNQT